MDLNQAYADHQRALMGACAADNDDDRASEIYEASQIGLRISTYQHGLGAAAACAWSTALFLRAPVASATVAPRPIVPRLSGKELLT